jgi:hypothetical protein
MVELITYSGLTGKPGTPDRIVQVRETQLHDLLRMLAGQVEVDETWYRGRYLDVDNAIRAGDVDSGQAHYVLAGYFENRFPREIFVDEEWYLSQYQDVKAALRTGRFENARQHFETEGFNEGRLPYEGWSL